MGTRCHFSPEKFPPLKMLESYPNLRKPMANRLFRYARERFFLKFRIYRSFQEKYPQKNKKIDPTFMLMKSI